MNTNVANIFFIVGLFLLVGLLFGALVNRAAAPPKTKIELELIEPEAGVRCAVAHAPNAVAINCWEIEE